MPLAYQHTPLDNDGAIRVLELSPVSFGNQNDLHCYIRSTTFEAEDNKFEALSYTWGDTTNPKTIKCNESNAPLQISSNCYDALRRLRHQHKARTLWVDAICINQSDRSEWCSQVKIMGKIFAAARRTVAFLGDNPRGCEQLFEHLPSNIEDSLSPTEEPEVIHEPEELFKRPWFSRIWVVQEIVNARSVIFMCGPNTASLEQLLKCFYHHQENEHLVKKPPTLFYFYLDFNEELTRWDFQSAPVPRMHQLLSETGLCKSTKPQDRILALIPLLKHRHQEIEGLIDYSLSPEEVFWKLAVIFMKSEGLALFWMIRHPHHNERMPSWVPDWADNTDRSRMLPNLGSFFNSDRSSTVYHDFKLNDEPGSERRLLTVKGAKRGYIDELGPILLSNTPGLTGQLAATQHLVDDLVSMIEGPTLPGYPESIREALVLLEPQDIFTLLRSRSPPDDTEVHDENCPHIEVGCTENRIFITQDKELGICSKDAQRGDLVCLVKGAPEACILRQSHDHHDQWNIISGDCLLLGIEHGYVELSRTGEYIPGIWSYLNDFDQFEYNHEFTIR